MAMMSLCQRYSKKQGKKYKHTRLMLLGSWGALCIVIAKGLLVLTYCIFLSPPTQLRVHLGTEGTSFTVLLKDEMDLE